MSVRMTVESSELDDNEARLRGSAAQLCTDLASIM